MPNNALERTAEHRGPHPGCQPAVGSLCMRQAAHVRPLNSIVRSHAEAVGSGVAIDLLAPAIAFSARSPGGLSFGSLRANHGTSSEGSAKVTHSRGKLLVQMPEPTQCSTHCRGTVGKDGVVRAKFTNLESDNFVDSPTSGRYRKQFYRDVDPCGMELCHIDDGYNFLGIKRDIRPPECKP